MKLNNIKISQNGVESGFTTQQITSLANVSQLDNNEWSGTLNVDVAYRKDIKKLENKGLTLIVKDYAMLFESEKTKKVLVDMANANGITQKSDLTEADMAKFTKSIIGDSFKTANLEEFTEAKYMVNWIPHTDKGVIGLGGEIATSSIKSFTCPPSWLRIWGAANARMGFAECKNLRYLDLSNVTEIAYTLESPLKGCSNLTTIIGLKNVKEFGGWYVAVAIETLVLPSVEYINLSEVGNTDSEINTSTVVIGDNVKLLGVGSWRDFYAINNNRTTHRKISSIIIYAKTVPNVPYIKLKVDSTGNYTDQQFQESIYYVPDDAYDTYINDPYWKYLASRTKKFSLYPNKTLTGDIYVDFKDDIM